MKNNFDSTSEGNSKESNAIDGSVDFGSVLTSARKFKNYTVEQVSDQLKIPVRTIAALEANDINVLPPPTFTQGYIRTYAKFLEISEDKVLAIYNRAVPHGQAADLKPRSNLPEEASSQSLLMKTVTVFLILAGIMTVIYGIYQYYQEKAEVMETALESKQQSFTGNSLDSPGTDRLIIKQNARLTEDGELIVQPSGTIEDSSVVDVVEVEASSDLQTEVGLEATLKKAEPMPEVVTTSEPEVISLDVLKISAENGSWMQVRDASNARLLYNMVPVGEVKTLRGQAPFRISLGNAKTTHVTINDLEIDMSEYIRENNTAKFSVSTDQQQVVFH